MPCVYFVINKILDNLNITLEDEIKYSELSKLLIFVCLFYLVLFCFVYVALARCSRTHYENWAGLKLKETERDAAVSLVPGLKALPPYPPLLTIENNSRN